MEGLGTSCASDRALEMQRHWGEPKDIPGESAFRARANSSLGNQKLERAKIIAV
jgi:hypothetical protein